MVAKFLTKQFDVFMKQIKIPFLNNEIPLVVIIIGALLIIGGIIFILEYSEKDTLLGLEKRAESQDFRDSDNDGLRDWEEELYHTDPLNPDSDGDGYLDGEEVDSGHNPLVKAPGDKLSFYPLPLGKKYNITDKIFNEEAMQDLFTAYLTQKADYLKNHPEITNPQEFLDLTEDSTIEEIVKRSIGQSYNSLMGDNDENVSELSEIFAIKITDEQIKISEDNSKEAIKLYISGIADWLNSDIFFFQNESLQAIAEAFQNNDFSKLDKLIKLNDSWINTMREIKVPSSWKEIHKEGLRIIILTRNVFISLRDCKSDPLKAYYAVYELESLASDWTELIKDAINLTEEQQIELSL